MLSYLARRLLTGLLVVFGVTVMVFGLTRVAGDPAALMLPPSASAADIAAMRERLGLDDPLPVQYVRFLGSAVRGDFGKSLRHGESALPLLVARLPATFELGIAAVALALVVAIPLGVVAALTRGTVVDVGLLGVAVLGQAVPNFWLAILLINVFSVGLGWFPTAGRTAGLASLVLPAVTTAMYLVGTQLRLVRGTLLEVLNQDYMRTARSKGLGRTTLLIKHGLRNALIPVITIAGVQLGHVLGQAVVIETVFQWPGLGLFTVQAITGRDFPVTQAAVTLMAVFVVGINIIVDALYGLLDPTIRTA